MTEENNNTVTLKLRKNASILVTGKIRMIGPDDQEIEVKERFSLCRCGHSKNKPFCDSSHKEVGFNSDPV